MSRASRYILLLTVCCALIAMAAGSLTANAATAAPTMKVKLFFVATGDAGKLGKKIGCDDSIVGVTYEIPRSNTPVRDTLAKLLALKDETVTLKGETSDADVELSNTLSASELKVSSFTLNQGVLRVYLTGTVSLAGECDDPRIKAQIEETVGQFSKVVGVTVKSVQIMLNGKPIDSQAAATPEPTAEATPDAAATEAPAATPSTSGSVIQG